MPTGEQISCLLTTLYTAPTDPAQWQQFLVELSTTVDAHTCAMLWADHRAGTTGSYTHSARGVQDSIWKRYNSQDSPPDPFAAPFAQRPRIELVHGEDLVPHDKLLRTEFNDIILEPAGFRHLAVLPLFSNAKRLEVISVWRNSQQGMLTPDSMTLLELVMPHVRVALNLRKALEQAQQRANRVEAMLDTLTTAAFLVDARGRVAHMNSAALALAQSKQGIVLRNNRLYAANPSQERPFDALIVSALAAAKGAFARPCEAIALHRPGHGRDRRPLHAYVAPFRGTAASAEEPAHALVLISDPEKSPSYPQQILRALYGLSRVEAELANLLLAGMTLEQAAAARHVGIETLRTQLKSLLLKTATGRQSELLAVLAGSASPCQTD